LHELIFELAAGGRTTRKTVLMDDESVNEGIWHRIFNLARPAEFCGESLLDIAITFSRAGKRRTVHVDNYRCTSHAPLHIHLAESPLPKSDGWHFGEVHCHTSFTDDQVEFGAPLCATRTLARAIGLQFFCATDHSYDLDDEPDDFLKKDPHLKKWKALWREANHLNSSSADFVIVPGEEVSVGNHKNRNVHFLILNNPGFLPGDGDGAERWLRNRPTASISGVLSQSNSNSAAFAAHPAVRPPLLQRLLVRRGQWEMPDFDDSRLHGLQVWNGSNDGLEEGIRCWVKLLLQGRRLFICGGNDAHGNFNRFRQIGFPFLTMRENGHHIFGKIRTAVYLPESLELESLLAAMKRGNMVITDGPFLDLTVTSALKTERPGGTLRADRVGITCVCAASREFGALSKLTLWQGSLVQKAERVFREELSFENSERTIHEYSLCLNPGDRSYIRAELHSQRDGQLFRCFSNPIWLEHAG